MVIGLGSNQGASVKIMQQALIELERFACSGSYAASQLWRTSPVDCPPGSADFINAAACFDAEPGLTPEDLLSQLKDLEREYGRGKKLVRNAPRELDLDLLVYNDERRHTEQFTLPHPRAVDRLFVLAPVAEIAAQLIWPGTSQTVAELLAALETDEHVTPLSIAD